jgi:glycosyltransferase involved in cell wall biosynthesis
VTYARPGDDPTSRQVQGPPTFVVASANADQTRSGPLVTNKPDVSVVIPMHNASATVTGVVESFLAVEGSAVEVIVVDDASTDDSVERVNALGRPEVVVERFTSNRGAGVARNRGFERASGRYTLFFDADDEIHPVALASAIGALDDTG